MSNTVLFKILNDIPLQFEYTKYKDDIYQTLSDSKEIDSAEINNVIQVLEWDAKSIQKQYVGAPEPILDNGLKFVEVSEDGRQFNIHTFGEWKCLRCDTVTFVGINNDGLAKEPFECENEVCKRKSGLVPLFPKELIKPIWKLPGAPMSTSATELFKEVREYIKDHIIITEDEYDIMTLWMMSSWLVDDFNTIPYLMFIAPKSSGKTQALNVISELGYRSFLTVSVTPAAIFRAVDLWNITLLVDEAEFQVNTDKPTESSSALYGLLNGGYKRGNHSLRVEGESGSRLPTSFKMFGYKAIASTKVFLPTLESRSIIINMTQGMPKNILIDEKRSQILRSKLLYWRYSTLKKLPIIQPDSKSGRLIEIFTPLYTTSQALKDSSFYASLIKNLNAKIHNMEHERKEEEKSSVEAQIVQAIVDLKDADKEITGVTMKGIALELGWADETNKKELMRASQRVGYSVKAMGLKPRKGINGSVIDLLDEQTAIKLDELQRRFLNA